MLYGFWADLLVAFHVAYVSFIVLGQAAIVAGVLRGWEWVRNPWFRYAHLLAIAIVAFEALAGIDCPLTVWEDGLRGLAGQEVSAGSFVGRCLHDLIFYDFQPWALTTLHVGFACIVLITSLLAPPRRRSQRRLVA